MSAPILYRAACLEDAAAIAQGMIQAGAGFLEFALVNRPQSTPLVAVLAPPIRQPEGAFSYQSCDVAVAGEAVVGGVVSFPAELNEASSEFQAMVPSDRLAALENFFNAEVPESWYIDTLWVDVAYRRRGIGQGLIERVQARANGAGRPTLSLMAWASKTGALAFYAAQGFTAVKTIPVGQHPAMPHPGGFVLLQRELCPRASHQ